MMAWANQPSDCAGLTFVCTDTRYRGRGAATELVLRVQELAGAAGLPIYLESTENAVGLYQKLGFVVIDSFQMPIPSKGTEGTKETTEVYKEVCMLWQGSRM